LLILKIKINVRKIWGENVLKKVKWNDQNQNVKTKCLKKQYTNSEISGSVTIKNKLSFDHG